MSKTPIVLLRAALVASALLLCAAFAHIEGCGSFVSWRRLLLEIGALIFCFTFFSTGKLEGPRLATLVVLSQLSVHFILGGMMMNNQKMLLSHIVFGFIAFRIITGIENFSRKSLTNGFPRLFVVFIQLSPIRVIRAISSVITEVRFFSVRSLRLGILRAPPKVVCN